MNKDLLARTKPEFYAEYMKMLREGGVPQHEIDEAVAHSIREARALLDGKCPKCGAPSTRYIDHQRQHGVSSMPGVWVQYRCSTQAPPGQRQPPGACDFMMDLKEGGEAN